MRVILINSYRGILIIYLNWKDLNSVIYLPLNRKKKKKKKKVETNIFIPGQDFLRSV